MLESLEWKGEVELNGKSYDSCESVLQALQGFRGDVCIVFTHKRKPRENVREQVTQREIRIHVRQYMTKPPTPDFNFHDRWNGGKEMPLRTMQGVVLEETKGMVKMELHGVAEPSVKCMKCGRTLTHPVSMKYGIGPECGGHFHIDPDGMSLSEIRKKVEEIHWTGWVIKSAIIEEEEI